MESKVETAIRMAGHLFEHHPTTGVDARNKNGYEVSYTRDQACSWCLIGAQHRVVSSLRLSPLEIDSFFIKIYELVGKDEVEAWEGVGTTNQTRLQLARKLQQYVAD